MLLDAGRVQLLAGLLREGARSVSGRRRLTPAEITLLQAVELYAYDMRSAPGTVAVQGIAEPGPLWLTVDEAAKELHVSPEYVRRLARTGALVAERHGRAWMLGADSVASHRGEATA